MRSLSNTILALCCSRMFGEQSIVESSEIDDSEVFGENCHGIYGNTVISGTHYIPGPDPCTECFCYEGQPTFCQPVECIPKVITIK